MVFDFTTYLSSFSWRYGSRQMRWIWSERYKYERWRRIWVELARAHHVAGLLSREELRDLEKHEEDIDIGRILELEKETKHDVVAAIREFAEKATIGAAKIHLGATSMDIVDNADTIRMREAMVIIKKQVDDLLKLFAEKVKTYASVPCLGYTHLQPAEPTTVGYRLAVYAQDLLMDTSMCRYIELQDLRGKGFKGAVGTAASYKKLLEGTNSTAAKMEEVVLNRLHIEAFPVTTQVYPRKVDYWLLCALASTAQSVAKFAEDLRILQSPGIGEWSEPFGEKQVGSSAMPFKKNPVSSEKICSLARYLSHLPAIFLENATLSHLERTLDDSANRRLVIPEAFLALDEILLSAQKILKGLVINKERIAYNLAQYGSFAATEVIIIEAVKRGANRQEMHELLRTVSMEAWQAVGAGKPNPMAQLLRDDKRLARYLKLSEIEMLLDVSRHVGDAPKRARELAKRITKTIHYE